MTNDSETQVVDNNQNSRADLDGEGFGAFAECFDPIDARFDRLGVQSTRLALTARSEAQMTGIVSNGNEIKLHLQIGIMSNKMQ